MQKKIRKIFRSFSAGIIQPKVEETSTLSVHRTKICKDFSFPPFPSHYLCFSRSWQVQDLSQVFALSIFWWFSTFKNRKPNSAMIMFWQKAITQTLYLTGNLLSAEQISTRVCYLPWNIWLRPLGLEHTRVFQYMDGGKISFLHCSSAFVVCWSISELGKFQLPWKEIGFYFKVSVNFMQEWF